MDPLACACWLTLSIASVHIDPKGMNQFNPGIGVETHGWAAGEYRNSLGRTSVYAGKQLQAAHLGVLLGAVSGYPTFAGHAAVVPLIAPYATYSIGRVGVNVALIPSPLRWNETALALQIKIKAMQ
jgi:hypothetical protein